MPVFLRPKALKTGHDQEADRVATGAGQGTVTGRASGENSALRPFADAALASRPSGGEPLAGNLRDSMQERLGASFDDVRVHRDAGAQAAAGAFGANAFTIGRDVYFGNGQYHPESADGDRLLAHELAHVVQQEGRDSGQVQFDLAMSMPTALGAFEIGMVSHGAPHPGMEGEIHFLPDPSGPYSAEIGLIQVVNVTEQHGAKAGNPMDWTHVGGGAESGRMDLMTQGGLGAAPKGWFVDSQTAVNAPGSSVGPNYQEQWGMGGRNQMGWLRSPTDIGNATLYDFPWFSVDTDFDFETVAKATDTRAVYGALHWGFHIRSGVVGSEYAYAIGAQSATFEEALERFRGYYTHEPVVIYFDTDHDTPVTGEAAKIADALPYLTRYPDVRVNIDGYADERGTVAHNASLALRRADNVEGLAVMLGIDPARINLVVGHGETTSFAAGANAGTWRANRRVVISFERTASAPITP
jgi:Domain of unknown function (DUF4157)/OmpA family